MTLTRTHTRVHVYVEFANPYLQCGLCHAWITGWHNPDKCGCNGHLWNQPCGHEAELKDACPSWSPVDGCTCLQVLGSVDHAEPPAKEAQR